MATGDHVHTHYLNNNVIHLFVFRMVVLAMSRGRRVLQATTCNTPTHGVFKVLAYAVILAFSFGMPLCAPGVGRHRSPVRV